MKRKCSMCRGAMQDRTGLMICPHCDESWWQASCPDCAYGFSYEGIGPRSSG